MSDKLERVKNLIMYVIETEKLVVFGSKEHIEIINLFENINRIEEIKEIDNKIVNKAIEIIMNNQKLLKILNNDIEIDAIK
jgi:hypothetical protein